jgi:hypothetical protein
LEKAFTEAPMGPYYLPDVKRAVLQELRSAKTAKAALKESIAEALHALELDASVPALAPALLPAGAYSAADFAGVAWIGLKDVKRAGRATLRVEAGLPAETDGVFAPWPMVTYRFAFDGELGADGYADVSLYLGGLHLAAPLAELRVLQWDGNEYIDVTSGVDSTRGVIMARSNRLSSYIVGRPATPDR